MAMAMPVAADHDHDIAPAEASACASPAAAAACGVPVARHRGGGWFFRRMYAPVGAEPGGAEAARRPRQGGWLRRLVPPERVLRWRRRWKLRGGGAAASRLLAGLQGWSWKRASVVGAGGWAAATLDAAAFRVMYVVEAVVLGLALSCFFCCCGCQI